MQTLSEFQQALVYSLVQASDPDAVFACILEQVCHYASWDYGEVWTPSANNTMLELHKVCYVNGDRPLTTVHALEQFRSCSKGLFFLMDVGLPGRVWLRQQAEWLPNVATESERVFLRHHIAKAFGVKTGFGAPVMGHDRVLAILVFFSLDSRQEDQQLIKHVTDLLDQASQKLQALGFRG